MLAEPHLVHLFEPHPVLDFAWLELTNQCNLTCVHCYAESGPYAGDDDLLTTDQHVELLDELHAEGCRKVQFIGGEPTLNRGLPRLLSHARARGFELIEVFTNLYSLDQRLISCFKENGVTVATSFYSAKPAVHDAITTRPGSFRMTVDNISRLLKAGIPLRAGIIVMDENRDHCDETAAFLRDLGVKSIGTDRLREIGRASDGSGCAIDQLCGNCANGVISIGADGSVAPCAMSRKMAVGSVLRQPLKTVLASQTLEDVRRAIYHEANRSDPLEIEGAAGCYPCGPNGGPCNPNGRGCNPGG